MTASVFLAGVLAAAGALMWRSNHEVQRRLVRVLADRDGGAAGRHFCARAVPPEMAVVLAAGAVGLVAGGHQSVLALFAAAGFLWLRHLRGRATKAKHDSVVSAAVAPSADLLAACLVAGAPAEDALSTVAAALEGPLGEDLTRVALALRAGAEMSDAWALAHHDALAPVARAFVRATRTGAPVAASVSAAADEQRRVRRWQAEAAARKAGVLAVGPLVVCFLPAFILVGVLPIVIGTATQVLDAR